MANTFPRYTVMSPGLYISDYAIVDEWFKRSGMIDVLEKRYASRDLADKDCKVLNKAQYILSNGVTP